jgi:tetratricopeptide (TPR) repeat protein
MAATSVEARQRAFEASAEAFRQALQLMPDEADFHDNLGSMYQELDRALEALPHHERAVALEPARAISRLNYGNALFMLKNYSAASEQYRRAVEIEPDFVDAWDNLAVALVQMDLHMEAVAAKRQSNLLRKRGGG